MTTPLAPSTIYSQMTGWKLKLSDERSSRFWKEQVNDETRGRDDGCSPSRPSAVWCVIGPSQSHASGSLARVAIWSFSPASFRIWFDCLISCFIIWCQGDGGGYILYIVCILLDNKWFILIYLKRFGSRRSTHLFTNIPIISTNFHKPSTSKGITIIR